MKKAKVDHNKAYKAYLKANEDAIVQEAIGQAGCIMGSVNKVQHHTAKQPSAMQTFQAKIAHLRDWNIGGLKAYILELEDDKKRLEDEVQTWKKM